MLVTHPIAETSQPVRQANSVARLGIIDGIRGWAAVIVVLFHLISETFGGVVPSLRGPLIRTILNGQLAVSVFFVLSGDALSASYFLKGSIASIERLVVKRYVRLAFPCVCACLLAYLLMSLGLTFSVEAGRLVHSDEWLGGFLRFAPSLPRAVRFGLAGVFNSPFDPESYGPFLWTMPVELVGSMLVFLYLYVFRNLRHPIRVLLGLVLFMCPLFSHYAAFFFGVYLGHLRSAGGFERLRQEPRWRALSPIICCIVLVALAAVPARGWTVIVDTVAAGALVFCFNTNPILSTLFETRLSAFLGRLSFPLYLTHFSVIVSLTSYLILQQGARGQFGYDAVSRIVAVSFVAMILAALPFLLVEKWTNQIGAWIVRTTLAPDTTKRSAVDPLALQQACGLEEAAWDRKCDVQRTRGDQRQQAGEGRTD
ncbi:MAG TPA: acyltransferase [Polyangiaceae bacterium]|jgi:peptidoglycan/LPS O-acetylase OafA/YrhL|nr:acyltransferase [Polyangiaceae bacterium]